MGLKYVSPEYFFIADEIINGRLKVTDVEGFYGVFKNSNGLIIDLREPQNLVNFSNLFEKDITDLAFILDSAITGQINCLKYLKDRDDNFYYQLKKFLKKFRKCYINYFRYN